jgi:hypothetical protein
MLTKNIKPGEATVIETSDGPIVVIFTRGRGTHQAEVKIQAPRQCLISTVSRDEAEGIVNDIKAERRGA